MTGDPGYSKLLSQVEQAVDAIRDTAWDSVSELVARNMTRPAQSGEVTTGERLILVENWFTELEELLGGN